MESWWSSWTVERVTTLVSALFPFASPLLTLSNCGPSGFDAQGSTQSRPPQKKRVESGSHLSPFSCSPSFFSVWCGLTMECSVLCSYLNRQRDCGPRKTKEEKLSGAQVLNARQDRTLSSQTTRGGQQSVYGSLPNDIAIALGSVLPGREGNRTLFEW